MVSVSSINIMIGRICNSRLFTAACLCGTGYNLWYIYSTWPRYDDQGQLKKQSFVSGDDEV